MHGNITAIRPPEPIIKHRTITLTNRAPARIVEDDWPIRAQAQIGESEFWEGDEYGWSIQIFLRQHKDHGKQDRWGDAHEILHAKYEYSHPCQRSDCSDDRSQSVRVGRILAGSTCMQDGRMLCETIDDLWRHIRELGDELRERINNPDHRRQVTNLVDKVFAALEPHDLDR